MPLPRDGKVLDFSRWQQNLIGILQVDVAYNMNFIVDAQTKLTIDARLAYRNKDQPDHEWKFYAASLEHRELVCNSNNVRKIIFLLCVRSKNIFLLQSDEISCSTIPLFELGSLHHDFYLLNVRLPVDTHSKMNLNIGHIKDLELSLIYQNGGFTKVWVALKTVFLPMIIGIMVWFWRRVHMLQRSPVLLEYMLIYLGSALTLLNSKLETCNHKMLQTKLIEYFRHFPF